MAQELNLKSTPSGGGVRVSWDDNKANDTKKGADWAVSITVLASWLILGFIAIAATSGWPILLSLIISGGAIFWYQKGSYTVSNAVEFTPDTITHQGRSFPTKQVTRFDYGLKSALTGVQPARAKNGNTASDPTIIRIWIDDAEAYTISENNWQTQVNHKIRDALAAGLDAVRKDQAAQEKADKFGDQGDLGMPDY